MIVFPSSLVTVTLAFVTEILFIRSSFISSKKDWLFDKNTYEGR